MKEAAVFGRRELTEPERRDLTLRLGGELRFCRPPQEEGAVRWLRKNRERFSVVVANTPPKLRAELFHAAGCVPVYSSVSDRQVAARLHKGLFGLERGTQKSFTGWQELLACDLRVRDLRPGGLSGEYPRFLWISRHRLGATYLNQLRRWCGVRTMACWERSISVEECRKAAAHTDIVAAVLSMELLAHLKKALGDKPLLRLDFTTRNGILVPRAWQELQKCEIKTRMLARLC